MSATIRYERNAMMSAAHLCADDGGRAYVFCAIPGGTPWFSLDTGGRNPVSIVGAPSCATHREFVAFVNRRFVAPTVPALCDDRCTRCGYFHSVDDPTRCPDYGADA